MVNVRAKLNDRISDVAMEIYSKRVIPLPLLTILSLLRAGLQSTHRYASVTKVPTYANGNLVFGFLARRRLAIVNSILDVQHSIE